MADTTQVSRSARFREATGLPQFGGNAKFLTATIMNSMGSGLVMAFLIVFFAETTDLSLVEIGAALTIGRLVCLPIPAFVGPAMDRFGSRAVAAFGDVLACLGFVICVLSQELWQVAVAQILLQIGSNVYWTCSRGLVVLAARSDDRTRWFGLVGALRNVGAGFGTAVTAIALTFSDTGILRWIMIGSAAAFLLSAILFATWKPVSGEVHQERKAGEQPSEGYKAVLANRPFMKLVTANVSLVLAAMVLPVLLVLYVTEELQAPAWLAGGLVVLNMVIVAVANTIVTRWTEGKSPARMIAVACALNAASFAVFAVLTVAPAWAIVAGLVGATLVFTAAEMIGTPPSNELSVELSEPHLTGRYMATFQLSWALGVAVAPLLLTAFLEVGSTAPWIFLVIISLLAIPVIPKPVTHPKSAAADAARTL